jgi:RND superfamily putative drug exporter
MAASQNDLFRGELIALAILLIALFFIFGGLRAALLPIFAALATTAGALLLLGMTHLTDVASYAVDVIILFGLALAVDYSLLMVNRFREARAAGQGIVAAVARTEATAGRAVTLLTLIPALLVMWGAKLKPARRPSPTTGSSAGWPAGCRPVRGWPRAG